MLFDLNLRCKATWKWALSFRSHDWQLADYPIHFREQSPDPTSPYNAPRFVFHRFLASIVNWNLTGHGDSKQAALDDLQEKLVARKAALAEKGKTLPRPGTKVPIRFTTQERVNAHRDLADDFIQRVLQLEDVWISDGSSLWDFHTEESNHSLQEKIKEVYGVSVEDIESGKLCEIFDRIADSGRTHKEPLMRSSR
jgi:hypothetical protein